MNKYFILFVLIFITKASHVQGSTTEPTSNQSSQRKSQSNQQIPGSTIESSTSCAEALSYKEKIKVLEEEIKISSDTIGWLIKNSFSRSALYDVHSEDIARFLIDKFGMNVNAKDDDGQTPLHLAVSGHTIERGGNKEIFKKSNKGIVIALIEAGADVNAKSRLHGRRPLDYTRGDKDISQDYIDKGIARVLIEAGAKHSTQLL